MGYERKEKRKTFKLKFTDPEMDGLEVRAGTTSMEGLLKIASLQDEFKPGQKQFSVDDLKKVMPVFEFFAGALIDWNLTEDGEPVPCTVEGLLSQDPEFIMQVVSAWAEAVGGASAPLGPPSQGGTQFPVAQIPMETLSPSRAS